MTREVGSPLVGLDTQLLFATWPLLLASGIPFPRLPLLTSLCSPRLLSSFLRLPLSLTPDLLLVFSFGLVCCVRLARSRKPQLLPVFRADVT